jgi:N-acetylneuraminate synthase
MNKIFIISEIGINHNGDLNLAKKMIEQSVQAGANAVKFQKRDIDLVYSKEELDKPRVSPFGTTQRDQKKGLEFGQKEYEEIDRFCKAKKIDWFASAWDLNSLNFLKKFDLKYNKIASAMIVDLNFLNEVAKQKKYTFISTGMSSFKNIDKAVEIFRKYNCTFELMHTISAYPFDDKKAQLNLIKVLRDRYKCKVGYSGHERGGLAISFAAAALGASSIERHFTLDRTAYGSDQAASITPLGFSTLIGGLRQIEEAIDPSVKDKKILEIEIPVAQKLRSHIKINK